MTTAAAIQETDSRAGRIALAQVFILVGFALLLYRGLFGGALHSAVTNGEASHLLALPVLAAVLLFRRRTAMVEGLTNGSILGLPLMLAGIAVFFLAAWPFSFLQPRRLSLIVVIAGAILSVTGWRVFRLSLPILFIALVAVPIGTRFYAGLIIMPEALTLEAARATLDIVPEVLVELDGADLLYTRIDGTQGAIALGEPHRGFSLPLAMLTLALFVTFSSIRPTWHVIVAAILAGPVMLLCNYLRVVAWGLLTLFTDADPLDGTPRTLASLGALILVYLAYCLLFGVLGALSVKHAEPAVETADAPADTAVQA